MYIHLFFHMSFSYSLYFYFFFFFFFNDTATTEIYTLSLHDALPICRLGEGIMRITDVFLAVPALEHVGDRSEEHTSELQSLTNLVCRLLLEKKKKKKKKKYNEKDQDIIQVP